jgi:hypothetical protein
MITCELEPETFEGHVAVLRRLRDELQEDLDAASDSVRWLRAELRVLERTGPKVSVASIVCTACGLGALVGGALAVCGV